MSTNDIRLIAMDMDGTLLNAHQQISPENLTALHQAQQQGIHLAICTGRNPADIGGFVQENAIGPCALLALNGACCLTGVGQPPFSQHTLDRDTLVQIRAILEETGLTYAFFSQNRIAVMEHCLSMDDRYWAGHLDSNPLLRGPAGLDALQAAGVHKVVCVADQQARLDQAKGRLLQLEGLDAFASWAMNLEMVPKGCNKGSAVRELAQQLGLQASQVMALGDYDNDISMIAYAGCGVAMGNAQPNVKAAAKHITLTNEQDGVAYAIRRYALL